MPLLGAHMSIAGGLHKAFERIRSVGGEALQIFTRNQRQWQCPPLSEEEIALFHAEWANSARMPVAAHGSYLINLARSEDETLQRSIQAFTEELQRAEVLEIPWVITHPGAHLGAGMQKGVENFVRNLDRAMNLSDTSRVQVLVETTAGQGTCLGGSFGELAFILDHSTHRRRLGVCVDTCHLFAAGHDIRDKQSYRRTFSLIHKAFGLDRIRFIHLNDSKAPIGSRLDRHEHIGRGELGLHAFRPVLNDPHLAEIPMTLETPKGRGLEEDRRNLATLRALIKKP